MRRGRQLVLVPGTFTYVLRECCSVRRVRNTGVLTQQYIQYRCTLLCTRCSYIRVLVPKCDTWYLYLVPCTMYHTMVSWAFRYHRITVVHSPVTTLRSAPTLVSVLSQCVHPVSSVVRSSKVQVSYVVVTSSLISLIPYSAHRRFSSILPTARFSDLTSRTIQLLVNNLITAAHKKAKTCVPRKNYLTLR